MSNLGRFGLLGRATPVVGGGRGCHLRVKFSLLARLDAMSVDCVRLLAGPAGRYLVCNQACCAGEVPDQTIPLSTWSPG